MLVEETRHVLGVGDAYAEAEPPRLQRVEQDLLKFFKDQRRADIVSRVDPVEVLDSVTVPLPCEAIKRD